jgi:hypothetical protein
MNQVSVNRLKFGHFILNAISVGFAGAVLAMLSVSVLRFFRYMQPDMQNDFAGQTPLNPIPGDQIVFPEVVGANLEGKRFELPRDFTADYTVVVIAYEQWHQYWVDTWTPLLAELKAQYGERFAYYELPTMGEFPAVARSYIDGMMVSGIPDKAVREKTVTLYLNVDAFNQGLNLPNARTTYTLLLDREGHVLWRAGGQLTSESAAQLREQLAGLMG